MTKNNFILSPEEIRETFESIGYFANEEIIYDTFNALCLFLAEENSPGQDIYAICLDGPPGAGKTEFAHAYTKVLSKIYNNVEMVSYQCDATTSKTELFEDINVVGAVTRDKDKVNIPGYLVKAIQLVNKGKRVILFIDEYDKAREETDSFFYQLLQSGVINTNQHGDIIVKEQYKDNLQVIFCRNDFREKLSGPLTRRLRMLSLDYITPELFHTIAVDKLINRVNKPVNEDLLNLVSLMYEVAYDKRIIYNRLPAASEMMIAISDANRLMTLADAPKHIIYKTLVKNMFKDPSDLASFEASLKKATDEPTKELAGILEDMKKNDTEEEKIDLKEELSKRVFKDEYQKLKDKAENFENTIKEYEQRFKELEEKREQAIEEELNKIKLANGSLISRNEVPNVIRVFEDETAYIKRGMSVFNQIDSNFTDIAVMYFNNLVHHDFYEFLINNAADLDIEIYEDGVILKEMFGVKLMLVNDYDENDQVRFRFMSSEQIVPGEFIEEIEKLLNTALKVYEEQTKTTGAVVNDATGMSVAQLTLNALVYDDKDLLADVGEEVEDHVYHIEKVAFPKRKAYPFTIIDHSKLNNPDLLPYKQKIDEINKKKKRVK